MKKKKIQITLLDFFAGCSLIGFRSFYPPNVNFAEDRMYKAAYEDAKKMIEIKEALEREHE